MLRFKRMCYVDPVLISSRSTSVTSTAPTGARPDGIDLSKLFQFVDVSGKLATNGLHWPCLTIDLAVASEPRNTTMSALGH
jgi:hypothetical protein